MPVALAVVTAGAGLLPLAARQWWIADLAANFRWQLLALQTGAALLLIAAHRARWLAALIAPVLLNVAVLAPYWPRFGLGVPTAAAVPTNLKVMTVNVRAGNTHSSGLLREIRRESPDVLLVVEYTHQWSRYLKPLARSYPYRFELPQGDPFGIALFSRLPMSARRHALESTNAIEARVNGPAGPVRFVGVHLVPPMSAALAAERNRQLQELAAVRAGIQEPVIIFGDFNVSPFSPHFGNWLAQTGMRDTLRGQGPAVTWPTFLPVFGIPIDQLVVSSGFAIDRREQLARFGSDHYPVFVELTQEEQR